MAFRGSMSAAIVLLVPLLASVVSAQVFDISKLGAVSDNKTDTANAYTEAWKKACNSTEPSTVLTPKGDYFLSKIAFMGPCKAPIKFQLDGNVVGHPDPAALGDVWFLFSNIDQLTILGSGAVNGHGQLAWDANECSKKFNCKLSAKNFNFNHVTNSTVTGITSLNSKNFHVSMDSCINMTFENFKVEAPGTSINTDGIHLGRSKQITIRDTEIKTGDDCISIGDGCENVTVTNVSCGPGHGISVGSLGRYNSEKPVKGVVVNKVNISGTTNGVRIKTWPGMYANEASDMHFEDVEMNNVSNPILIDQVYCPWNQCKQGASKVKISDVSFKNIRGTSFTNVAVKLLCSQAIPCEKVVLEQINMKYTGTNGTELLSECTNVKPTADKIPPGCQ